MFRLILLTALAICSMLLTNANKNHLTEEYTSETSNNVPYLVSIRYKKNNSSAFEHRCSGTIYSTKVILTTASCLISLDPRRLHVKAGSPYRTKSHGYLYLVEKYIIHPDFNILLSDNDLALLVLKFDFPNNMNKEIANISLVDKIPTPGSLATKSGWGLTDAGVNIDFSEILQTAQVNTVNISDCKQSYGEFRISPAMLCATGKANVCSGDVGGTLVYQENALGLKSWGFECGNSGLPDVYTNLVYFKDWIESEISNL